MDSPLYPDTNKNRTWFEKAKAVYRTLRKEVGYNLLLYPYAQLKFQRLNKNVIRSQEHTYTSFYRSPGQISAILGPVIQYINSGSQNKKKQPLQINILAGSTGAEAYTLASIMLKKYSTLDFQIHCSDLHQLTIQKSQSAKYSISEIERIDIPENFIIDTFDYNDDDSYTVKSHIKDKVTFFEADIVNDKLNEKYPAGDIVFLQNVLFHLETSDVDTAFYNALSIAKYHSVIFIDGMPLDSRVRLTKEANIKPLNYLVKEIHEYARRHVPLDWWNYYYGTEPYLFFKRDRIRRFSTIFLRKER